ncbi:unc-16 [Pristionchus pacificus]|uniref:Unc-16 n=1 Tax=Pristionchus pacificus TaxID=54126 RepID=A0A2A6CDW1_PRIPA|nr:unc-16 [Pristionchus pacificus]|eukprot:PDM76299.1 unc-16 [Pristionchus pacificus]
MASPGGDPMAASTTSSTASEVSLCMERVKAVRPSVVRKLLEEVVYGSGGSPSMGAAEESTRVMSEKVQNLAASIYREFEQMINSVGEDSVKNLMPLVVNVLEALDLSYLEKEEMSVDLEMLKEDNEQLITQYEREKQLRKAQDNKYIEIEDGLIGERKELETKIESLESIMRMLELKAKNATDHSSRLEEREADQKAEFERLHERYNVLLRTHIDHMERTKYLMGSDKFEMMNSMPVPGQQMRGGKLGMATSVDASSIRGVSDLICAHMTQSTTMDVNLANHISNEVDYQDEFGSPSDIETSPREDEEETERRRAAAGAASPPSSARDATSPAESAGGPPERIPVDRGEPDDSLGADLTGMGREVENLIKENTELLDMKNALNVVKNDLIAQVDELSSEQEILREEIRSHEMVRAKMGETITALEVDLKMMKQKLADKETEVDEERLMELEETVKWTEMQRAKKAQAATGAPGKKQGGMWDFFAGLFGGDSAPPPRRGRNSDPISRKATSKMTKSADFIDGDIISERRQAERREQYRQVRERVRKAAAGRLEACGWSVAPAGEGSSASIPPSVPVPVCCRPLLDQQPTLKVWCATGVILRGGRVPGGGAFIVGQQSAVFAGGAPTGGPPTAEQQAPALPSFSSVPLDLSSEWASSSMVWVASSNQGRSHVAILDANNPNNVVDAFHVCDSHLLSITSVPGVFESDPSMVEVEAKKLLRGSGGLKECPAGLDPVELGCIEWCELRTLEAAEDGVETLCTIDLKPSPERKRDFSVSEVAPGGSDAPAATWRRGEAIPEGEEAREFSPTVRGPCIALEKWAEQRKLRRERGEEAATPPRRVGRSALPPHIRDAMAAYDAVASAPGADGGAAAPAVMDSAQPTVWMGSQNQYIYIHSAITDWRRCIRRIKMPDAVLAIVYVAGRVFAALANGTIAVFHRNKQGTWSTEGYHVILVGRAFNSVRNLTVVEGRLWAAYKNCIVVINPTTLDAEAAFIAHPRKDSQVRSMQAAGAGVWVSIRLDSTLRLFHSRTHAHLQDVDIEPYLTKVLGTSRLDFSYVRTTALLVSNRRLWIGTGTGVIISVPLSEAAEHHKEPGAGVGKKALTGPGGPGGLVRVYAGDAAAAAAQAAGAAAAKEGETAAATSKAFIPYCNLTQAQFSFHGHKDAVKFFLSVPGECAELEDESAPPKLLVMSGGDGYIDFRVGEEDDAALQASDSTTSVTSKAKPPSTRDMSHLIIWEMDADR